MPSGAAAAMEDDIDLTTQLTAETFTRRSGGKRTIADTRRFSPGPAGEIYREIHNTSTHAPIHPSHFYQDGGMGCKFR